MIGSTADEPQEITMAKDATSDAKPLDAAPSTAEPVSMTPAAALARHLEWLEYALAAAKDEEGRRQGRLERATDKNRGKRTRKLTEVSAEVRELDALVRGIRELQANAPKAGSSRAKSAP
jgi:hypothetical protein